MKQNKYIHAARLSKRLCCVLLLSIPFSAMATYWCQYVCGRNGYKHEEYCVQNESGCSGYCLKIYYTMKVSCWFCGTTIVPSPACAESGLVSVPATSYKSSCGGSSCGCVDPFILDDPSYVIWPCPTTTTGFICWNGWLN